MARRLTQTDFRDSVDDSLVRTGNGADDSSVSFQTTPMGKVEFVSVDVRDDGSGFDGDKRTCGMIPNSLDVSRSSGQAEIGVRCSGSNHCIFCLTVESYRFMSGEDLDDARTGVMGTVARFN